jgi:hypothetical protein
MKLSATRLTAAVNSSRAGIWPEAQELDPYFANVSLLLHMDGGNGSTTFTDSSSNTRSVAAAGGAQISTAQSRYGTGAFYAGVDTTAHLNVGSLVSNGDFTVEFYVYPLADRGVLLEFGPDYTNNFQINQNSAAETGFNAFKAYIRINGVELFDNVAFGYAKNQWNYIALTRSGSNVSLFNNGVLYGTRTLSGPVTLKYVGSNFVNRTVNGYIDELRLTDGIARPIEVPTTPFPNA